MTFQSGLTNPVCFSFIAKKNEGDNQRKVDSCSGKNVGPLEIHHIKRGDLEVENPILNV